MVFPKKLFGLKNQKVLFRFLKKSVFYKRFETFSISDVYDELNMGEIRWFKRGFNPLFLKEIHSSRKNIIIRILLFIFEEFVLLIKANFYVTEKHDGYNKLFYYPKNVWFLITKMGTLQMEIQNLDRIDNKSKLEKMKLKAMVKNKPIAKLRFVPKKNSLRPIMTFYKKFRD